MCVKSHLPSALWVYAEAADISPEPSKVTQSFDGRLLSKYAMI